MKKATNEYETEKKKQEQNLEALLLEGLKGSKATPLTHLDFEEIRKRATSRLKAKSDDKKAV
jgi:hypothetical protein